MATTYDPSHALYFDEPDLRLELTRVFDLCHGCRLCLHLCPAFPTLFNSIDARDGDVEGLTPTEQNQVVDECYQCKLCYIKCPYIPPHEWDLDFPRLMMRANAVKKRNNHQSSSEKLADQLLSRTDLLGTVSVKFSGLANKALSTDSTLLRKAMEKVVGIAAQRVLPPYAKQRFSVWFKNRIKPFVENRRATAVIYPTCFIEYQEPAIGKDLVAVYERNGIECSLPDGVTCCGAPWLHSGDVDHFKKTAEKNVTALVSRARQGNAIVVSQPTCAYVIKRDYPLYLQSQEAKDVAGATYDAAEYLMDVHKNKGGISLDFNGPAPASVTYHAPCHLQAQNIGFKSRDLLKLTGTKVTVVNKCSGIDGTWGYRKENYELSKKVASGLVKAIEKSEGEVLSGDCHLANTAITEETERRVFHPIQIIARAYGIKE
ncbi:MAG: heterodisulfide reductase-related iron-sulfur binding cluster [Actinomycetota bacterium]|nr:heterodisulfide reductase-related iron-sulfur binding cluster [Actinomycetota bacterium]